ncbi:MAG: alpha/beta fold hydrolase [Bacteroidales bacterium]|nr:alpha/beta fold hydrolase [Bacteroidales bacterium]
MINLKSELEIRTLHEKIDHFIMDQQQELLELQQTQIEMMSNILKQIIQFILFITFFVLVVGCNHKKDNYPAAPTNATADSFIIETKPYKIGDDTYKADFGTITVRENRSKSTSRLINIPFLRIQSKSKNPAEPIFGFAGGPGQSNMTWNSGFASMFLSERDFVVVGYRGVDGSTILDCPEVGKALKGEGNDLMSEESIEAIGRAWRLDSERIKDQGVDIDGYTMLECIEDNESVRKALNYERINLVSESYGTRVAYLYGLKHPNHIFRTAMISVNPPGRFVWDSQMIDNQLKYYANLWLRDSIMSKKSPDLYATMEKILNAMPRKWLFLSIDPGKVKVVTFCLLFHRNTAAQVFDAYLAAEQGDPAGLAMMSLAYDYIVPSMMTWGDLASKAVSADFDPTRNYFGEMDSSDRPLGSPMSKLLWGSLSSGLWPIKQISEEFRNPQLSEVETLLLSGSIDFSTPAEFATTELMPYLKNGKQIIFSEYGHVGDVEYTNMENTRLILSGFYNTGVPDTSKNTYIPMDFSVKWGFPIILKIALGGITLVGIGLCVVMIWLFRRYRKKPSY